MQVMSTTCTPCKVFFRDRPGNRYCSTSPSAPWAAINWPSTLQAMSLKLSSANTLLSISSIASISINLIDSLSCTVERLLIARTVPFGLNSMPKTSSSKLKEPNCSSEVVLNSMISSPWYEARIVRLELIAINSPSSPSFEDHVESR